MRHFILKSKSEAVRALLFIESNWEDSARAGQALAVEIKPYKSKRSIEQNARLHALLATIAEQVTVDGRRFGLEVWKQYYKERLLPCDDLIMPSGEVRIDPISTTKLNVEQFNDFMTQIEADAVSEYGVEFTDK